MADNVILGPVVSAGFILQAEKVVGGKEDAEFGGHRLFVGPKMMVYLIIEACFHMWVPWLLVQHLYSKGPNISKLIGHAHVPFLVYRLGPKYPYTNTDQNNGSNLDSWTIISQ